ncbi:sulfite exporter TauE/SafE family protein [Mucilaginibacter lutimaris]|uniref:Sulfite exporter TauE/SafE family protein n=1 Tax=Mucilaginibacter lutimaris TaxID=931629 RepID=A0ABW2ZDZ0_9SPHI
MENSQVAFLIGLFGSVHCVGMCGPLAFSIPSAQKYRWLLVVDKLLYNFGRITTYAGLGLLLGTVGKLLWLSGMQQILSILSGIFVIAFGVFRLVKFKGFAGSYAFPWFYKAVNMGIKHKAGHFVLGILNGFLPCGFVYVALFGALNTTSPADAAIFMFWFGMGTLPLMFIAMLSLGFLSPLIRRRINVVMPYLMICLGCWFILRGSGLNIPYLSPVVKQVGVSVCH